MSRQISPFAELSGAERQIRWLEYQSIRLPYVKADLDGISDAKVSRDTVKDAERQNVSQSIPKPAVSERPQPPPEVPRTMPSEFSKSHHSQYDAVIARLKQAELQSRRYASQTSE